MPNLNLIIMKKLQLLKTVLDFFFVFSIIAIIALFIFIPYIIGSDEVIDIPLKINGVNVVANDWSTKMLLILCFVAYCFFVFAIFQLRKVMVLFSKRIIFDNQIVLLLNQVGKCFLAASLITSIPLFIYNLTHKSHADIEFGGGFSSFLFTASLGLLFMVLSEVFNIAKNLKEENDLTV